MNKAMHWTMVTLSVLGFFGGRALAGQTNAPAAPTDPASAMWTLSDIYNVLDTRTTNVSIRTTMFTEPTSGPAGTMYTLNDIMALVTNRAPVAKTGQVLVYADGDDAAIKSGVAWPAVRFTVGTGAGTNCVTDKLTGLMWARDASNACGSASALVDWVTAVSNCNDLFYGGYDDWRLPNISELQSLLYYGAYNPSLSDATGAQKWSEARGPFKNVVFASAKHYWTSTAYPASSPNSALTVDFYGGLVPSTPKTGLWYVWPVRGGGQ